jgi:hypothetical protein
MSDSRLAWLLTSFLETVLEAVFVVCVANRVAPLERVESLMEDINEKT